MVTAQTPVVLISGASRGLGLEAGRQMLDLGWRVAFGMRDPARGRGEVYAFGADDDQTFIVPLDVTREADCAAAVQQTMARFGRIDALINNAGVDYDTDQRSISPHFPRSRRVLDTNLWGAWQLAVAAVPHLVATRGNLVNVSSQAGQMEGMGASAPAYSISKAALNALTIKLAAELKPRHVRVNAVCPGWTNTDMGKGGRPVREGAKGIVWAATLDESGPTGGFFRDGKPLDW